MKLDRGDTMVNYFLALTEFYDTRGLVDILIDGSLFGKKSLAYAVKNELVGESIEERRQQSSLAKAYFMEGVFKTTTAIYCSEVRDGEAADFMDYRGIKGSDMDTTIKHMYGYD